MSNGKTATEWLFEKIWDTSKDKFIWHALLKQAKEMEKQQINDAFESGENNIDADGCQENRNGFEQYYNETYNTNHE
jgi:hypothetical protein